MQKQFLYWENIAVNSLWGKYIDQIEKNTIENAFKKIKNKNCILEIGCESGKWLDLASKAGFSKLIGTDINPDYEKACKLKNENIIFYTVNPNDQTLPCTDNSVDLLLVIEVPSVIHCEWFYKEAKRILTPDGIIVGVVTNKFSWRGFLFNRSRETTSFRQKELSYTQPYYFWKRLIKKQHFDFLSERGYCSGPFQRNSNSIFIPLYLFIEKIFMLHTLLFISPWIIFIIKKT